MKTDKLVVRWDEEYGCYDVEVFDWGATAGDFELTCDQVLSDSAAKKIKRDSCLGCSICCTGRIPLTSIDVIRMNGGVRDITLWIEKYARIEREGESVDITMKVDCSQICRRWSKDDGGCLRYSSRAFACRTYICAPMSHRLELLRSEIINKGEDELVRLVVDNRSPVYDRKNAFAGKENYHQIRLKEICSPRLWRYLVSHD